MKVIKSTKVFGLLSLVPMMGIASSPMTREVAVESVAKQDKHGMSHHRHRHHKSNEVGKEFTLVEVKNRGGVFTSAYVRTDITDMDTHSTKVGGFMGKGGRVRRKGVMVKARRSGPTTFYAYKSFDSYKQPRDGDARYVYTLSLDAGKVHHVVTLRNDIVEYETRAHRKGGYKGEKRSNELKSSKQIQGTKELYSDGMWHSSTK